MLLAKQDEAGVTLTDEHNNFLVADATRMEQIKELSANICLMGRIQPANINSNAGLSYDYAFLSDRVDVNSDRVEYDNNVQASYELDQLARNAYKEAEKQKINANKVTQQNKVLTQLLELYKEKVRVFEMTKGDNATFLNEFIEADSKAKRYKIIYTLKKAISHHPKIYEASCFGNTKIHVNVRDTEDILDDATKSQKKMDNKFKDPIAIEKKQNVRTINYNKLNALYEDFVPQKELWKP
ncbi:hypothetical protein Tco_0571555 [Tanacetum coccineum]